MKKAPFIPTGLLVGASRSELADGSDDPALNLDILGGENDIRIAGVDRLEADVFAFGVIVADDDLLALLLRCQAGEGDETMDKVALFSRLGGIQDDDVSGVDQRIAPEVVVGSKTVHVFTGGERYVSLQHFLECELVEFHGVPPSGPD